MPVVELMVVDDGSTDSTDAVSDTYGLAIIVLKQLRQGKSCARNSGFAHSHGDCIAFLDSDDACYTGKLLAQLCALSHHQRVNVVDRQYENAAFYSAGSSCFLHKE